MNETTEQSGLSDSVRKRRTLGIIASLVICPGSGHVLLGENTRALAWFTLLAIFSLLIPYSVWFMLLAVFGTRVGSVVDLWRVAKTATEVPESGVATLRFIAFGALSIGLLIGVRAVSAEAFKIPAASMEPTLRIGDHLFVRKFMVEPERGAVAVFVYPCEPQKDFIKRIVALEGDLVEVRCDKLYVNNEVVKLEALEGECFYWDVGYPGSDWEERECKLYKESLGGHDYQVIHDNYPVTPGEIGAMDFPSTTLPTCRNTGSGGANESAQTQGSLVDSKNNSDDSCGQSRAFKVPDSHFFVMGDNRANSSDSRIWGAVPNGNLRGIASYIWWSEKRGAVDWSRFGQSLD